MVLGKGKGCLQACRFAEVPGVVHAIVSTALEQLQQSHSWQSNASFARSACCLTVCLCTARSWQA